VAGKHTFCKKGVAENRDLAFASVIIAMPNFGFAWVVLQCADVALLANAGCVENALAHQKVDAGGLVFVKMLHIFFFWKKRHCQYFGEIEWQIQILFVYIMRFLN
jgi:hypothetical protein